MRGKSISHWMYSFSYGRPISKWAALTAAKYFRPFVGALVMALLALHLAYLFLGVPVVPRILAAALATTMALYLAYLVVRARIPSHLEDRYYMPAIQCILAQGGIANASLLLVLYAIERQPHQLWPLFVLSIIILSKHCSTLAVLIGVGESAIALLGAAWWQSCLPAAGFLRSQSAFLATGQVLALGLLTFLLHYLMRNLDARDERIEQLRNLLVELSRRLPEQRDPVKIRRTSLELFMEMVKADFGAVWVANGGPDALRLETEMAGKAGRALPSRDAGAGEGADRQALPQIVAKTGVAHCVIPRRAAPSRLRQVTLQGASISPCTTIEIGVPLRMFQAHRPESAAVLVLGFGRAMGAEEMERVYRTAVEVADMLSPIFYYVSLIQEHLALRGLGHTVSRSLEQVPVMEALLDLITTTLGFDFATVSLVDEARQTIGTIRGRNVDPAWVRSAVHPLDSNDIQAYIVRTGQTETLTGWDERFDPDIWNRFGHEKMVRIFMPMTVVDWDTGRPKHIGTVEAGYWQAGQFEITRGQVDLLQPFVDQAALAVYKAQLYDQAQRRANVLERLHEVGEAIQRAAWSLPRLMQEIGDHALDVLQADVVFLYRYDEDRHCIEFLHTAGEVWGHNPLALRLDEGNILDWIIAHRRPFYTDDAQNCPELVGYGAPGDKLAKYRTFTQRQEVQAFAGIPLMAGERLIGIMCVNHRHKHSFTDESIQIVELFAQKAAMALETARLREWDRERVLQTERRHLARDLHDALVQDLYGIGLKLRTLLHEQGDKPALAGPLRQILKLAEGANGQIGYLVDTLHAPLPGKQDFRVTIQEMVERVRRFYGLEVIYQADGVEAVQVSALANTALAHVAQESITNAVRHARARCIDIRCWQEPGDVLCLQIKDDGVGFDPDKKHSYGRGLENMREFAHEANGQLEIESVRGHGAQIAVHVPLDR